MRVNFGLLGQVLTVWCIVACVAAPMIGRYLRARRVRFEFKEILERVDRDRVETLRGKLHVADSHVERQRLAREAATPISENQWLANARRAEALGFLDSATEIKPKRAS